MKTRIWCAKHKKRHSIHAWRHCHAKKCGRGVHCTLIKTR